MGKQLDSCKVTAIHVISLVCVARCENALPSNAGHHAAVHDIIEDVGQLRHAPSAKMFERLNRYSIWSTALIVLTFSQLSFYLFMYYFLQWALRRLYVSLVNTWSCLIQQIPEIVCPSVDISLWCPKYGTVLCFNELTWVVIFSHLVSSSRQSIDCLFTFSGLQSLLQVLHSSCASHCYCFIRFFICRVVFRMVFLCFRMFSWFPELLESTTRFPVFAQIRHPSWPQRDCYPSSSLYPKGLSNHTLCHPPRC